MPEVARPATNTRPVMTGLVPVIHVFCCCQMERRGWPLPSWATVIASATGAWRSIHSPASAERQLEGCMKCPAVYIMASKRHGTLYTGVTADLVRRVAEHKYGVTGSFCRRYGCVLLVYFEMHEEMASAIAREKQIKAGSRRRKLELIEGVNPYWRDLFAVILRAGFAWTKENTSPHEVSWRLERSMSGLLRRHLPPRNDSRRRHREPLKRRGDPASTGRRILRPATPPDPSARGRSVPPCGRGRAAACAPVRHRRPAAETARS